jgi:lysophospholipid acyltransferase (LPLAT)-like uncharacterized protein
MKIQSRKTLFFAGRVAAALVRTVLAAARVREFVEDPDWHPYMGGRSRDFLLATWHENLLVAAWWCGRFPHFHTLASPSRDGEIITGCASSLGMKVLRGSSYDGGARALKQIVDFARSRKRFRLGVTPDGPRGPRRCIQPGVAYVASRTGLPVVSVGIACENGWRAPSWDRLQIPKPFARVHAYLTAPVWAPPNITRGGIDEFSAVIANEMNRAQDQAADLLKSSVSVERRHAAGLRRAA